MSQKHAHFPTPAFPLHTATNMDVQLLVPLACPVCRGKAHPTPLQTHIRKAHDGGTVL
jgi:hypothetical protein